MTYKCACCGEAMPGAPERSEDQWIIRCFSCGARNIIVPIFKLVDWR